MSAEMLTLEDYNRMVAEGSVDTVICATPDMHGRLVGKRLTTQAFQSLGIAGTGIHASTYLFASDLEMNPLNLTISNDQNGYLDFRMVPDLTTMRRVPWEPASVLVLCDALQEDSDDPITVAPRQVLRQQIQRATERGLMLKFASELEFFLAALPPEEAAQAKYRDLPMTSQYRADYQILQSGRDDWFIRQLRNQLPEFGIPIESSKTEWGLGQQELTLDYCEALRMADMHVLFKHAVKDLARKNGLTASFMPKLHIDEVGSSCHLHVSLWSAETGEPLDWGNPGMSPVFASFVAGQLEHAIDLGLMFAPTVNSYKRFVPDQFAGTSIVVGNDNRSCAFRLVGHGHSFRLENRIPGADANPTSPTPRQSPLGSPASTRKAPACHLRGQCLRRCQFAVDAVLAERVIAPVRVQSACPGEPG